jgi:FemAB-related protein (PEP-CTERM system-associated)
VTGIPSAVRLATPEGPQLGETGPADRERWERFVAQCEGELGHEWAWLDLVADVFRVRVLRLAAVRDGDLVGVLPLVLQRSLLGRFLTSVPYLNHAGVLAAGADSRRLLALEALRLAERLRADRLELRGRRGGDLPIEVSPGKCGFRLGLDGTAAALWDRLGSKVRAQVKRPRREGYASRIVSAGERGHRVLWPLLARRWHELGSPVLPRLFFERLEALLGGRMEYVVVEQGSAAVAAGALVRTGSTIEIPWAASAAEHNRYGVNMLLYWTALERAVECGAATFDFGRSTAGSGNAQFKLQWGAREEPLEWNVRAFAERGRASEPGASRRGLAAAAWRGLPAFVARRLGPWLAARIPL